MQNLVIIKTLKELEELKSYLANKDYIAFDTETTGVDKESKIIGFSVSFDTDTGYYVILSYWDKEASKLVDLETTQGAKDFLQQLASKQLIMHNCVFDCNMVENNYQVRLIDAVHTDTLILGHILDENRSNGLKELGVAIFGEDAKAEQIAMKESVSANGGVLTKDKYELYKADADLIAKYGAKDAILTIKIFYLFVEELYAQGLYEFFYEEEAMPLLKGPTYDLNSTGLKIDIDKLAILKGTLESECMEAKSFIYQEVTPLVQKEYPGTTKPKTFNIGSSKQLSWLLFIKLHNEFSILTKEGRNLCKALDMRLPYSPKAKREFIDMCINNKGRVYQESQFNTKTRKMGRPKKIADPWNYIAADKATLAKYSKKYKWVEKLLEYNKNQKLLTTYVEGIQSRMKYGIIRPSFLQHGTTSGRYSSKNPNFQNLPRDDKRIKSCIISRPGKVFVGADYSQLEPRVFASFSKDTRLLDCFKNGDDFYSVIGKEVFDKYDCTLKKDEPNSFAKKYPKLRDIAKTIALSTTYGTTAHKMAPLLNMKVDEAQEIIDSYFRKFPSVKELMLQSHEFTKAHGVSKSMFGRLRRLPKATLISTIYGKTPHAELPYEIRNMLNLAINHKIQSTGASIMNRAAIECWMRIKSKTISDKRWTDVKIVLQVHDELILEGPESLSTQMVDILKQSMEDTVSLPGVALIAEPKVGKTLAELK